MKKDKKDRNKKVHMVILTKPETIFNNDVARNLARERNCSCASVRKVLKGLLALRAELEEDRPGLFRLFIDTWRYAAANVGGLADMAMKNPCGITTDAQYLRSITAPYDVLNNFVTGALIGEMTSAEELEFTITSGILASNWSKLFSIIDSRGCSCAETLANVESAALTLNHNLTRIYHSCEKPVVSAQWCETCEALETSLKTVLADLASFDPLEKGEFAP